MLSLWFGFQNYWEQYHKVTFDGTNKLILINDGETCINFKVDIYSAWKEWMLVETNTGFEQALSIVGGDPTPTGFLGITFFLENGWKIRTWEGDHTLNIVGNVYARDGSAITTPTLQPHNITVSSTVSNLVCITNADVAPIVDGVWNALVTNYVTSCTFGKKVGDLVNACNCAIADAVWDEVLACHNTAGTTGEKMNVIPTSGTGDWSNTEKAQIRDALGVDGTKLAGSGGTIQKLKTKISAIFALLFK